MDKPMVELVRQKKILCVCAGAVVRSVAQANVLKYSFGQDALAASWERNSRKTLDLLADWADIIIVMQPQYSEGFLKRNQHKVIVNDVGPDVWRNPLDPELDMKCSEFAQDLLDKGAFKGEDDPKKHESSG